VKTKNAQTLGVHLPDEIVDMIVRRARHNNLSKSKYAGLIIKKWAEMKYPSVSTVDSTAKALVKAEMDSEKSLKNNPQAPDLSTTMGKAVAASGKQLKEKAANSTVFANPKRKAS
jgi:hypothetical protein